MVSFLTTQDLLGGRWTRHTVN